MSEALQSRGEVDSTNPGREILAAQARALEFYISGMMDHPEGMPWASKNIKTGKLELTGDNGMKPPVSLAALPSGELMDSFLRRDKGIIFNLETNLLERHPITR